jgi:hypothetical protein
MVNFFRKTRKKLAEDKKPLKYMRYAIGEIVLVVVGILIALQINNWNEARSQKNQLQQYLGTLTKELSDDKERLRSCIGTSSFRVHSAQRLLELAGAKPINFGGERVIPINPIRKKLDLERSHPG